jgi:hypothetical protein
MAKKILLIICLVISSFAMNSAEININNEDLELGAKIDMANISNRVDSDIMYLGADYLYTNKDKNIKLYPFYELNFLMMRNINEDLGFGLGIKLNHTHNFTSSPLGFEIAYHIPQTYIVPIYLKGSIYYATHVLSYEDADNFAEYRLNVDIEVIEDGFITLGYRNLKTNYEKRGDITYNSSFYGGFRIRF